MVTKAMVLLGQRDYDELQRLAEAAYPEEFCAILLGRREAESHAIVRVLLTANVHANPDRAYAIAPEALIAAQRKARADDLQILGFAHSHPDREAIPSKADLDQAYWLGHAYGIVSVQQGTARTIRFFRLKGPSMDERRLEIEEFAVSTTSE